MTGSRNDGINRYNYFASYMLHTYVYTLNQSQFITRAIHSNFRVKKYLAQNNKILPHRILGMVE